MKLRIFVIVLLTVLSVAAAPDQWPQLTLADGTVLKLAKVSAVTPQGLRIFHAEGIVTVPWLKLPVDVRKAYQEQGQAAKEVGDREQERIKAAKDAVEREAAHEEMVADMAKGMGHPESEVRDALRLLDWCHSHPDGGELVFKGKTTLLDKKGRDAFTEHLKAFLGMAARPPAPAPPPQPPSAPVAPQIAPSMQSVQVVESVIEDEFEGYDPDAIYKLDNGQIWRQVDITFSYSYSYRPKALVYFSNGRWMMRVDGMSKSVWVERLR